MGVPAAAQRHRLERLELPRRLHAAARAREPHVHLRHRDAGSTAGVDDVEVHEGDGFARDVEVLEGEARVREPVPERERRGDLALVVPAVADQRPLGVVDHVLHARIAARAAGRRQVARPARERRRQAAARVDVAEQHPRDRRAAAAARVPGLEDALDAAAPGRQHRAGRLQHDDRARVGRGDARDQRVALQLVDGSAVEREAGLVLPLPCRVGHHDHGGVRRARHRRPRGRGRRPGRSARRRRARRGR